MSTKKSARKKGATKAARRPAGYATAVRAAGSSEAGSRERADAFIYLAGSVCDDDDAFEKAIVAIKDSSLPTKVRSAAISAVQAASFSSRNYRSRRPAYMAALRTLVNDPDHEMRQRSLGILSREKDGRAQEVLLRGLEDPARAVLPPEKALQLLSYDPKAEAYAAARKIVKNPPNESARYEALKLLGADAKSAKLFESILGDRKESAEARLIAAAALNAVAPDTLQRYARKIVLDKTEDPDVQATSLTAMSSFGNEDLGKDKALQTRVARIGKSNAAEMVKKSARTFKRRYSR